MLAKSIVAPLDRIKILYQVTSVPFYVRNVPYVLMGIVRSEGVVALWRGNTATMIRIFPYAGIQFMVFSRCKDYCVGKRQREGGGGGGGGLVGGAVDSGGRGGGGEDEGRRQDNKWGMKPMESLIAGSCAGAVSVLFTYPLDLTRAQLAVSKKTQRRVGEGIGSTTDHGFVRVLKGNYTKGVSSVDFSSSSLCESVPCGTNYHTRLHSATLYLIRFSCCCPRSKMGVQ